MCGGRRGKYHPSWARGVVAGVGGGVGAGVAEWAGSGGWRWRSRVVRCGL